MMRTCASWMRNCIWLAMARAIRRPGASGGVTSLDRRDGRPPRPATLRARPRTGGLKQRRNHPDFARLLCRAQITAALRYDRSLGALFRRAKPVYDPFTYLQGTIRRLNQAQAVAAIIPGDGYFISQPIGVRPSRGDPPFLGAFDLVLH